MIKKFPLLCIFIFFQIIFNSTVIPQYLVKYNKLIPKKDTGNVEESIIDVGNITSWVGSNGFHDSKVNNGSWNGNYPNGQNAGVVFSEGIIWGCLVYDGQEQKVRVNGNIYSTGCRPVTRIFRVRSDYKTANLELDASDYFMKPIEKITSEDLRQLKKMYETDWNEWPWEEGAIFEDVDKDGKYNPEIDIPGVPGATQTIFIKYDDSYSESLYESIPVGLQIMETYWGYDYYGVLGNVIFKKVDITYTGTSKSRENSFIDSMYICQWTDIDLGHWADDLAGCDTTLNLGYVYNGNDNDEVYSQFNMAPPAVGYAFLSGVAKYSGNPLDSAFVNLRWRKGYKYVSPKPMTTFVSDAANDVIVVPPFTYEGALEYYNILRGRMPDPAYPKEIKFPGSYGVTTPYGVYLFPGDPVSGSGIIDGVMESPSDRRFHAVSGPFQLNIGDTVETTIALVVGQGLSPLNSITVLKGNVKKIRELINSEFKLPEIPEPSLELGPLNRKIILKWGLSNKERNAIENFSEDGYKFEGYEVYQLPSANSTLEEGIKIANFDLINGITAVYDTVRDKNFHEIPKLRLSGKDNGISRFLLVERDSLNHKKLYNGKEYYFAVASYAYNDNPLFPFHIIRSAYKSKAVIPQTEPPGERLNASFGDTLFTIHTGRSEGRVLPIVIDPNATEGKTYVITFDTLNNNVVWNLKEKYSGIILLEKQKNQTGDNNYPIVRGILPKVISPPKGIKEVESHGIRWISGYDWGGSQFYGGLDIGGKFWTSSKVMYNYIPVELRFTGGQGSQIPSEENGWSKGAVYRKDKNYMYAGTGWLPLTAWDVSDELNPVQLNVSFVEDSINGNNNMIWDLGWDGQQFALQGGNEFLLISNSKYDPLFYNDVNSAIKNGSMYFLWPKKRGGVPYLNSKFTLKIIPNKINLPGDKFEYTSPGKIIDSELAKKDVEKINIFPNPYIAGEQEFAGERNNYVIISHLPEKAIIRIFDLSGVIVKTIYHNKAGQFENWDLRNENGLKVASGIYIVLIDMPSLQKSKLLKLAVAQ